ncbi:hypothetical protein QTI51_24725 [Variovorax sp. J22G73]|uniref:hypothetical protein n=1 Tax=unclassified Variovorax TaxID=663243 RepID=UPI002578CF21|nr:MULTISPECIES: hypothetical protein [unclassified Variovorax]MDM0007872.1 hypothetical protein [Variovorax sp. J22R203]MDM0100505.1 hypothetical protein [Variovorax sp. J22G73]
MSFLDFVMTSLASGAVSAVLLGAAAFMFKAQLGHWLNKDIERIKASHQRDLESYKVSLIAETEKTKASQEVSKAMAVLMVEKKFAALNRLHLAVELQASNVLGLLSIHTGEKRSADIQAMNISVKELMGAFRNASIYFTSEEMECFYRLANKVQGALGMAMGLSKPADAKTVEAQELNLFPAQAAVNEIMRRRLDAMLRMTD